MLTKKRLCGLLEAIKSEGDDVLVKIRVGERIDHFETVRMLKDGTLVSVSPIYSVRGKTVGAAKVARDISEANCIARANQLLAVFFNFLRRRDQ